MIKEIRCCRTKGFKSYYRFINEKEEEIFIYFDYIAGIIFFETLIFYFKGKAFSIGENNFGIPIKKATVIEEYEFTFNETIKKEFKEIKIQCDVAVTQWYKELLKVKDEKIDLKDFFDFYHEINKIGGD